MAQPTQAPRPLLIRIARRIGRFLAKRARSWRQRHQHLVNFILHLVGIPLTVIGIVLLFAFPWYYGIGALVLGYAMQFLGHALEGNDAGEWYLVKKLFGLPGVAI